MKTLNLTKIATVLAIIFANSANLYAKSDDPTLSIQAAASKHATYQFDTWEQVTHKWRMLDKAGMRLKDLEVLDHKGAKRIYAGVWEPGSGKHALYRYRSWSDFVKKWRELNPKGYRLVDIERVKHGNSFWYYGVWHAGSGKYGLYKYNSWKDFTKKWKELNKKGMRLVDIDVTEHNNITSYVGVWKEGSGKYALFNYASWDDLSTKWNTLGSKGYQLSDMDIVRLSNGTTRYIGVWKAGSTKRALYRYTSWKSFKQRWAKLAQKNHSLLDIEVVKRNKKGNWYIGSFGPAKSAPQGNPDLKEMAQYLEDNFSASVVGMSYAFSQNGQLAIAGSTGMAQRYPDKNIPMSSKIRSTVASVSKTITAPLLYKLLDANDLSIDAPIAPWLPASWVKGSGFKNNANGLTFRHLLTHTSGLNQASNALSKSVREDFWHNDWDGLRFIVENGTVPGSSREYKNANFALLRVLIPELWKKAGGPKSTVKKTNVGQRYLGYLHTLVLNKEAIDSITCKPQAGYPEAKSYNFGNLGLKGASNSTALDGCGGHAELHFSAQELTQYASAFRYDNKMMSVKDRNTMKNERAGWSGARNVIDGTAYYHDGAWTKTGSRHTRTCIMELPHGINASIIFNSLPSSRSCRALINAYNTAI